MALPKAITTLQESDGAGSKNWLIYGESGIGKTVLAGTAPRALFLTVEAAGTESAKAFGSTAKEWVINSWDELNEAYRWLKSEGKNHFDWIVVDSLSEMEELCWKQTLEEAHAANSSRSLFQPAIQDYQVVGNKIKKLVDAFNRLPINVIFTAQVMRVEMQDPDDEDEQIKRLMPLVGSVNNGVISGKICGMVTLVGLLLVRQPPKPEDGPRPDPFRRLVLRGSKTWVAKDRHDAFGRWVDNPNIAEMVAAVEGRKARGDETPPAETRSARRAQPKEND